jgi:aspartate aminotransferase-like enzyme
MGSGTLANDVIAGQLLLLGGRGLVLSNGEFGDRLIDHAQRFKLDFEAVQFQWGKPFDLTAVRNKLAGQHFAWLWCSHCETSTGVLNDLATLKAVCAEQDTKLCLDCISSIGAVPTDLSGVYLASCASGKALRAYPGLSMVFHHHDPQPAPDRLPRYLDLGCYAQQEIPFTFSSNLLHALHAAVKQVDWEKRFADSTETSAWLRPRLAEMGFELVGNETQTSPTVITLALPPEMDSVKTGSLMQEAGYLLSCNSDYLRRRNWIQICLMGEFTQEKVVALTNALNRVCFKRKGAFAEIAPALSPTT